MTKKRKNNSFLIDFGAFMMLAGIIAIILGLALIVWAKVLG